MNKQNVLLDAERFELPSCQCNKGNETGTYITVSIKKFLQSNTIIYLFIYGNSFTEIEFTCHPIYSFKVTASVGLTIFTVIPTVGLGTFSSPNKRLHPHEGVAPHCLCLSPWQPLAYFLSPRVCPFWTFHLESSNTRPFACGFSPGADCLHAGIVVT